MFWLLTHLTTLYGYNQAAIALTWDGSYHAHTKYVDIHCHFICFTVEDSSIIFFIVLQTTWSLILSPKHYQAIKQNILHRNSDYILLFKEECCIISVQTMIQTDLVGSTLHKHIDKLYFNMYLHLSLGLHPVLSVLLHYDAEQSTYATSLVGFRHSIYNTYNYFSPLANNTYTTSSTHFLIYTKQQNCCNVWLIWSVCNVAC